MSNNPKQFPLDLTGKAARNLIRNEERAFNSRNDRIFVPSGGVFYSHTVVMFDKATGKRLQPITDYKCLHIHEEASIASGLPACCVILVTNDTIQAVKFDYQVIGGQYSDNLPALRQLLDGVDFQSLTRISWGTQIYGKPETFPAAVHRHPGSEFGDWKRFHVALNNIYHALLHKDTAAWQSVYEYINATINALGVSDISNTYFTKDEVATQIVNALGAYTTTTEMVNQLTAMTKKVDDSAADLVKRITTQATTIDQVSASLADFMKIDQLKVSPDSGNLIEKRPNGLYYGIQAPADLTNLYVDAVGGNDSNPGTRALPFKTLGKALGMSPVDNSNTIHLKWIPLEFQVSHHYEITGFYTIGAGVTRNITVWGHSMTSEGEIWAQARNLFNKDVSDPWLTDQFDNVTVYLRQHYLIDAAGREIVRPYTMTLRIGATVNFKGIDLAIDHPEDFMVDAGYGRHGWNTDSAFVGDGLINFTGSDIIKVLPRDPSTQSFDVPSSDFYTARYNGTYITTMYSGQNVKVYFNAGGIYYGHAPNRQQTGTNRIPNVGKVVKDLRFLERAFHLRSPYHGVLFIDLKLGATGSLTWSKTAPAGLAGSWGAQGMGYKSRVSNLDIWAKYYIVGGIVRQNGVQTSFLSTEPMVSVEEATGTTTAVTSLRESIYPQPYKPGDIYQTTMSFRSSAEVAEVMGYGHWVRWGEGLVLVGMGGQTNNDQVGMPDKMFVPYGISGEYSHKLTIGEMPAHSHRFVSDDSVEGNAEFVRVALSGTADFSQKGADGQARVYRTPTKYPDESGGDQPHNNIQPFVTIDRWKRHVSSDGFYYTELVFARNTFEFNAGLNIQEWTSAETLALSGLTLSRPNAGWSIIAIKAEKPHANGQGTLMVRLQINRTDILANHMLFVDVVNDVHVWKKPMSHPRWGWQRTISSEGIIEIVYAYKSMLPVETQPGDTQTLPDGTVITVNVRQNARYRMVVQAATRIAFYKK